MSMRLTVSATAAVAVVISSHHAPASLASRVSPDARQNTTYRGPHTTPGVRHPLSAPSRGGIAAAAPAPYTRSARMLACRCAHLASRVVPAARGIRLPLYAFPSGGRRMAQLALPPERRTRRDSDDEVLPASAQSPSPAGQAHPAAEARVPE